MVVDFLFFLTWGASQPAARHQCTTIQSNPATENGRPPSSSSSVHPQAGISILARALKGQIFPQSVSHSWQNRRTTIKIFSRETSASASVSHVSFWSSGRQPPRPFFLLRSPGAQSPGRRIIPNPTSHSRARIPRPPPPSFVYAVSPAQLLNRQGRSSACARLRVEWVMMATCAGTGKRRKPLFFFFFPLLSAEGLTSESVRRDRPDGRTTRRHYHGPPPVPALYIITPRTSRDVATRALKHPYSPTPLLPPPPLALKRVFTPA